MAEAKRTKVSNQGFDPEQVSDEKIKRIIGAVNRTDIIPSDRIVYMTLVLDGEPIDDGVLASIMTIPTIMALTGLSQKTIDLCIKRLKAVGLVQVMPRKNTRYGNGLTYIIR